MNPTVLDEALIRYASGWEQAYLPRSLIALAGAVILFFSIRALFKKDAGLVPLFLWILLSGLLFTFALIPQQVINTVVQTEYFVRIRVIMGALSALVLLITLESIRRTHLLERYALLWLATGAIILLCVLFPGAIALLRAVTGMEYATAIVAVAFTFLVLVAFHFSISISSIHSDQSRLVQEVGQLQARLRELEKKVDNLQDGKKS